MKSKTMLDFFQEISAFLTRADIYAAKAMAEVSLALISKRTSLGLSRKEFAKLMGVTQKTLSRWESGAYNFRINAIAEIAEKIGCTFDIVLKESSERSSENERTDDIQP